MGHVLTLNMLTYILISVFLSTSTSVLVHVNTIPKWTISPLLASTHMLYTNGADAVYGNGSLVDWARHNRVMVGRYPGGSVASYWNWENPCGKMGCSTLDPEFDGNKAPVENWMSMEEYLDFCDEAGMTPLIGVNYNCHGNFWVSEEESMARAMRQVEYVVSRGYTGAYFYIGNEDRSMQYPEVWRNHALVMKSVDPTIKILFNCNWLDADHLQTFVKAVGEELVDGAEFHGKWPTGGTSDMTVTLQDWANEVPLRNHKYGYEWRERARELKDRLVQMDMPEFLLANNEFGLGNKNMYLHFTRYT